MATLKKTALPRYYITARIVKEVLVPVHADNFEDALALGRSLKYADLNKGDVNDYTYKITGVNSEYKELSDGV